MRDSGLAGNVTSHVLALVKGWFPMASLFRGIFTRPVASQRRRPRVAGPAMPLERLEPRLALAGDTFSRPMLERAATLVMDASFGPNPVVMTKSQVIGNDIKSFVIAHVPEGSVVEKWDVATETWIDVSTKPTNSNPQELMRLLGTRLIQQGDKIQWRPKPGFENAVQQAFQMINWDDGSDLPGVSEDAPSAVRNLSVGGVEQDGAAYISVAWESPLVGAASSYAVTTSYVTLGGETQTTTTVTQQLSFQQLLENIATLYSFTVTASNAEGTSSPESIEYNPATAMPSEPLALAIAPGPGDDEFTMSWQTPAYAGPSGSSIDYYEVTNWQTGEKQNLPAGANSVIFTGIEPRSASLFTVRAYNTNPIAGGGLLAQIAVDEYGQRVPLPPSNPFMGIEGLSTMHANAASSDVTVFPGPGTEPSTFYANPNLNAAMPSILMTENGALVCVGVGTQITDAKTPIVMLISPTTLNVLDRVPLVKPENAEGDLAGGVYNFIDYQNRLVVVDAEGNMRWFSNSYDAGSDQGHLIQVGQINISDVSGQNLDLVVGLVPDYEGRIWFATEGSINELSPFQTSGAVSPMVGYYDPRTNNVETMVVPQNPGTIPAMIANSISSSPAGVAVATTQELFLFKASETDGSIEIAWSQQYLNGNVRKPGQLSPGTGSTPVFFGPSSGYEYLVITDNGVAPGGNTIPAENVVVYDVASGLEVSQAPFLYSNNSGTENAPIAVGERIIIPSTYGYWYPPPSETTPAVPEYASFVGGIQGMILDSEEALQWEWESRWPDQGQIVPSSALPRLSMADGLLYTIMVEWYVPDERRHQSSATYSWVVIDSNTGVVENTGGPVGTNTWGGQFPTTAIKSSYSWNTLQMTGVISPSGVLYQGTAQGLYRLGP